MNVIYWAVAVGGGSNGSEERASKLSAAGAGLVVAVASGIWIYKKRPGDSLALGNI